MDIFSAHRLEPVRFPARRCADWCGRICRFSGFGLVRPEEDLQDYQIPLFREVAASKHSNKGKLRDYYYAALDIKSEKSSGGKPVTIPQAVKGGYLHCKDGQYYIRPVCGEVLRLSRKHSDFYALDVEYAQHKPVCYRDSGDRVLSVALPGTSEAQAGMKKGYADVNW